ncbi:MAG: methyltransferase [Tannerella sp.]|nr:methyltransferase [Tannerella sp.]
MSNDYFQFKKFTIRQDRCAMKAGTDGVLLGAWASAPGDCRILDVGAGTGLVALMLAQRFEQAVIDAIEIDEDAYYQSIDNIAQSPFKNNINVVKGDFLKYFTATKYDLIVSNPPYFDRALKSPDKKRTAARHNDLLPLKSLIEQTMLMLTEEGRIALILPTQLSDNMDFIIASHGLFVTRYTKVIPVEGARPKRFLIEISTKSMPLRQTELTLMTKDRRMTPQYAELTGDFYLDSTV